jgi:hypothetical protein
VIFSKNRLDEGIYTVFQTWQLHLLGLESCGERALNPLQISGPGKGLPSGTFVSQMWSFWRTRGKCISSTEYDVASLKGRIEGDRDDMMWKAQDEATKGTIDSAGGLG